MKRNLLMLCTTFFCVCLLSNFSNASEKVLSSKEVMKLFSDKKFTVTEAKIDKKTGKKPTYNVHAQADGWVRVVGDSLSQPRAWSVNEDGAFCYSGNLSARNPGQTCGYIVSAGGGKYDMYVIRGAYNPNRKIVGGKKSTHLFTFSNFK